MLKNSLLKLLQLIILFFLGFNTAYAWQTDATQGTLYGKVNISTIPIDYSTWHMDAGCSVTLVRNGIDTQTNSCATFSSTGVFTDSTVVGSTQYDYVVRLNNYNLVDQGSWVDQGHWVDSGSMVDNGYWYTSGWPADDPMCMNYSLCETTVWISDWVWVSNWVWSANWQWVPNIVHVNYSTSTISGQGWAKMPGIIADLTATQGIIPAKVRLNWTTITDATSYEVWRSLTPGGTATQLTTTSAITYDDTTTSGATHYYYTVKAVVGVLVGLKSNEAIGYAMNDPSKVLNVYATQGTLYGKVNVSWTIDPVATTYDVYRSTAAGTKDSIVGADVIPASFDDITVSGTAHYFYTVVAKNSSGIAPDSDQATGWGKVPVNISDLTATKGILQNKVAMSWSKNPDATGYEVWRSATSGGISAKIATLGTLATGYYEDVTVSGMTHYFYTVKSVANGALSQPSNEDMGYAVNTTVKVTGVTATQGTLYAKSTISWTADISAATYDIYRSTAAGTKGTIVGADVLGSSFNDTTVSGTTHYFYTIVSKNILGSAPDSDQATGWGKVPVVISDLAATKGTLTNKVGLSWSKNTDATGYEVWRSSTSGRGSAKIATLGILATGYYEDVTVSGMTQYYYTVKTVVDSVASQVSNEAMGYAMIVPLKIIGVTATQGTLYAQSTVTWTADPSAASYDLYRSTAAGTKGAIVGADVIGTSFNDTTVSGETHYFYTVVAKNAMGSAPDSNQATGWSKIPAVVSDLTATQGTLSHKVTLIWTDNPDATEYEVWRSTTPGGIPSYVASTTFPSIFFDTTVSGVTSYFYTIKTIIGLQSSSPSNEAEGWANAAPTSATAALTSSSTSPSLPTAPSITDPNVTAGKTEIFTLAITSPPAAGTLTIVNNNFVFTPPADGLFSGNLTFAFKVTDKGSASAIGSGTINVNCSAPSITSMSIPDLLPYEVPTAAIEYKSDSCNGAMSGTLTIKSGVKVIETKSLSGLSYGASVNLNAAVTGLPSGDYTALLSIVGTSGAAFKYVDFTVQPVPMPTLTVLPATGTIFQSETRVDASIEPSADLSCPLTYVQSEAEVDPRRCYVALTTTLSDMAPGTDVKGLPTLAGYPSVTGDFVVQAVVSRWVNGTRHDSDPIINNVKVTASAPPTFLFTGDTNVYMGIEKVSLAFAQDSGAPYSFYTDQAIAQTEAAKGNRAAIVSLTGNTGLTTTLTTKQIKLEGTLATVGVQKILYLVKRVFPDGMAANLQSGELSITVNPLVPPIVALKGGYKITEGKYYVPMGQSITNAVITAGVPTNAKMKLSVTDSKQSIEHTNVMSGASYWISTPNLNLLEERPVTLRVAWQDFPTVYNEQVITAIGGAESNMKLVIDSPKKIADTDLIKIKVNVGKYTKDGLIYTPETMGQWRTQILMQSNNQAAKTPITGMQDTVNGEATFQVNPTGNLWMKLTALSQLVSTINGLESTLESSTRYIEVVKGSLIQGAISSKALDGPAPKTFTLNLDMTTDNRVALKEVSWEESTDGNSWIAIEKSNTLRHNVTMKDTGKRQVRVKMINKNTLIESYTTPVEVWAYATLEASITGPRHMAPGYTATLAAELYRGGVLTTDTVNEWTIDAPSSNTTATGATITITEAVEGEVNVTLKTRPSDTRADDPNAWAIARYYLSVKTPTRPSVSAKGQRDVETGKTYHYEGSVLPSWGGMVSVHTTKSEWQKPDGSLVSGDTLDWTPTPQDMVDTKPLIFRAWVDGFKDTTTNETTVSFVPWQYVWPTFTLSMKQLTMQAPSDITLFVNHDQPDMNRRFEGLTYEWSFPANITGRQNDAFPNRAAGQVVYAGEYNVTVTIRDARGHETVLTQHIVAEQAVPYTVTLKVGKSNYYDRAPMTVMVRPTIYGGHPLDSVVGQLWKVDGIPVDEFTNRNYMVSNITDAGNHVVSYTLNSKMGETTTVNSPLNLVQNQPPVCELMAKPSSYVVYVEAKCTDPDGKVIGYAWEVNGQPIGSTSYRISFSKTTTPQSASATITGMDDAKELSTPVSINVAY